MSPEAMKKRIQRGMPLDAPVRQWTRRDYSRPFVPCVLNAQMRSWRLPADYLMPGVRGNMRAGL